MVASACDEPDGSDEAACAEVVQQSECTPMDACTFSPANSERSLDASGECTRTPFVNDEDPAGFCVDVDEGIAGATVPGVYYHVETERVMSMGLRPDPPPTGWELCTCGSGSPPACQCMDECQ